MIGNLPGMLRDITMRVVAQQADMEVVETSSPGDSSIEQVAALQPDVLIVPQGTEDAAVYEHLAATPALVVVAVAEDGRRARRYYKDGERVAREALEGLDIAQLIRAIRGT